MADTLLCSGNIPLTFSFPGETPSPYRYSSTASTAVCCEQTFPAGYPDPKPGTEDWFNFITGFDAGNYSAFGMSAYVTAVMPRSLGPVTELPSKMQFRTVISTADGSGSGDSAYIPVDGIAGTTEWTIYSSDSTTVAPGVVEVEHFEFSASAGSASGLTLYNGYDESSVGSTSTPSWTGRPVWHGVPGAVSVSASSLYESKFSRASTAELVADFNFYVNTAQRATVVESGFFGNSQDYFSGISARASATGSATANVLNWTTSQFYSTASASATASSYSGYTATATIAVPTINGGSAYAHGRLTTEGRHLLNSSWTETADLPTRTVLASASASGPLSSICGDYAGFVSASVGGYNDTYLMNPSGIVPGFDSTHTAENEYYWRMRSAWSAGYLTSTPVGCGISGILELYPKGGTGSTHPILSSATGG